jgi:hypothetical protein
MLLAACDDRHELEDEANGAPALWQEFALAFAGRRQLYWSKGLKARLDPGQELSDEAIAEKSDSDSIEVCTVSPRSWQRVRALRQVPGLLEAAESEGADGVREYLMRLVGSSHGVRVNTEDSAGYVELVGKALRRFVDARLGYS